MTNDDAFSVWIARSVLVCAGEDIQVEVLDDMVRRVGSGGLIDAEIDSARTARRRPGDFGAEFVGVILIPVLVEAARQLWAVYVEKVTAKALDGLAGFTVDRAKMLAHDIWTGKESRVSVDEFEMRLRVAANKQGLSPEQTEKLILAVRHPGMIDALKPQASLNQ